MSHHLPECDYAGRSLPKWIFGCICHRLQACEQRVLDAAEQAIRDALSSDGRNLHAELTALAAIDALREKP